jgi:60 kDa SS-A/Ro ribonucleoprotein
MGNLKKLGPRAEKLTPQTEAMESAQVQNSAGGYVWEVTPWTRLARFLILGTEAGTYYIKERELTRQNVTALQECLKLDGRKTVDAIVSVSSEGRAPKNDPALFALAVCAADENEEVRSYALARLRFVARTGTHLFQFLGYVQEWRGWGRGLKKAVQDWYSSKSLESLSYQLVKYRQREGWTHRDVFRKAHPKSGWYSVARQALYRWVVTGDPLQIPEIGEPVAFQPIHGTSFGSLRMVEGFIKAQAADSPMETARLIKEYGLPREAVKPEYLDDAQVWEQLLYAGTNGMPMTAMVRNLAKMARAGLLDSRNARRFIVDRLGDDEALRASRLHPVALLNAFYVYKSGTSATTGKSWTAHRNIIDALDGAFYKAFQNVEPTGKRHLLALDVSGSMDGATVNGLQMKAREAAVAMALVTMAAEEDTRVFAFCDKLTELPEISPRQRLDDAINAVRQLPFGGTDCSMPIRHALEKRIPVDAFVVYTDNETWVGCGHPAEWLQRYREKMGINARLITVGLASNGFTIADPNDPGMMDVVGFDASAPAVMAELIRD